MNKNMIKMEKTKKDLTHLHWDLSLEYYGYYGLCVWPKLYMEWDLEELLVPLYGIGLLWMAYAQIRVSEDL